MEEQQITLYLTNGETLRFDKVSNFNVDDKIITFDYISTSQGTKHSAEFFVPKLMGISYLYEEEE